MRWISYVIIAVDINSIPGLPKPDCKPVLAMNYKPKYHGQYMKYILNHQYGIELVVCLEMSFSGVAYEQPRRIRG